MTLSAIYSAIYSAGENFSNMKKYGLNTVRFDVQVIDSEGFRANVGIILCNSAGHLLWAKRIRQRSWQFPQGGIRQGETPVQAMYRELEEEIGLQSAHVEVIGCTKGWLRYRLPERFVRRHRKPTCIGQKQIWYMLRLLGTENDVRLDLSEEPEFDYWRWVDYWYPLRAVVPFKRQVYRRALQELAPLLFPDDKTRTTPPVWQPQTRPSGSERHQPKRQRQNSYPQNR
jgi:putative (di)nucleoside polyphosphate hydrolase